MISSVSRKDSTTAFNTNMAPEGFLRLDLDATFTAHITIQMGPVIDSSLVVDPSTWLQRGYDILDDIVSRGNLVAVQMKSELRQLQNILAQLGMSPEIRTGGMQQDNRHSLLPEHLSPIQQYPDGPVSPQPGDDILHLNGLWWQEDLTAENLLNFADSIDIDCLDSL